MEKEMKNDFGKRWWTSMGIVLGAIVIASVALYFLSNDLTAQADKIVNDQAMLAAQTATVNALAHLKADAPQAAVYAAAMGKLLPTHDNLLGFPQWLVALGQSHHVAVSSAFQGQSAIATAATPGIDGFSMTATGASTDLVAFLRDLEGSSVFLLSIDSVNLTNNGSAYQLNAQGKLFSR